MDEQALVIGATGHVGRGLMEVLEANGWRTAGTARSSSDGLIRVDLAKPGEAAEAIREVRPRVVFLAAAFTGVDAAEDQPELAMRVNAEAPGEVALACRKVGARLVHYSTDYIFDGASGPYAEDDQPSPVSAYGRSKLGGEDRIREETKDHLILRTTVVYGWDRRSQNFAMQVWRRLSSGEIMRVPNDQVGNPTLGRYLAEVTLRLVELGATGIINVVGRDRMPRSEFAQRLARAFALDHRLIEPVPTSDLQQRAARPLNGGLKTDKLEGILQTEAMPLDEAMKRVRRQWRAETYQPTRPIAATSSEADELKREILDKVRRYHELAHARPDFKPFSSRVSYAGRVYGAEEIVNLVDASLDFWLTLGPWGDRFEHTLRDRLGSRDAVLVNSGSSANLTAVTALMALQLPDRLKEGDEVITPAATFPTTIAPLLQNRLVPVLVDCELGTYNVDPKLIGDAISPRTRAIMVPHTLGNPADLDVICEVARRHNLFLIEDSCDALGSTFRDRPVGTFGDLATISFYPAHHITMGEGGAVIVNRARYSRLVRSIRDWGRDCWCAPGESNTCGKRFGWQLGELPAGYDHKYTYSNLGYNLKPTDMQAAIGVAQLERLDDFVARRRANFDRLYDGLKEFEDRLVLPTHHPAAKPSWFGFPITVREGISRRRLVQWLEDANIETRELFGGNILKQPGYMAAPVRVHGSLDQTDRVLRDTFFIGVYPGIAPPMIDFVIDRFGAFFKQR